jgi:hypothetical protein
MSPRRADHLFREVLPNVVCLSVIVKPRQLGFPGPQGLSMHGGKKCFFILCMCMQVFRSHPSRDRGEVAVWLQSIQNPALVCVGGHYHASGRFIPGKDPVPIVQGAGWASGWHGRSEKFSPPAGIRSPDRPTHSESLCRLSYPGRRVCVCGWVCVCVYVCVCVSIQLNSIVHVCFTILHREIFFKLFIF